MESREIYLVYKGDDHLMFIEEHHGTLAGVSGSLEEAKGFVDGKVDEYDRLMDGLDGRYGKIWDIWRTYPYARKVYEDGNSRPSDLDGLSVEEFDRLTLMCDKLKGDIIGSYVVMEVKPGFPPAEKKVYKAILGLDCKNVEEYGE